MRQRIQLFIYVVLGLLMPFATQKLMAQSIIPSPNLMILGQNLFTVDAFTRVYTNLPKDDALLMREYIRQVFCVDLKATGRRKRANSIRLIRTSQPDEQSQVPFQTSLQCYVLDINAEGITISSPSNAGIFYALQTIKALTYKRSVAFAHIEDTPRFAYRGFMLDCSRHFWTVAFIKKQIDMMAQLKLNRLHLHLTDAAGWRMESKVYPELNEKAAYRTASDWNTWWGGNDRRYATKESPGAYGGYYSQNELRDIVHYATQHYITVIPEIDIPGHSEEVTYTYPQLSCDGKVNGELCIGNEKTFQFIEGVLKEVMDIFPSEYIHMGGDEASDKHWKVCPKCQQRMQAEKLSNTRELQAYMMKRINRFLNEHGRKMIGWDEMIDGGLPEGSTVMAWRGANQGWKAAQMGHHIIMTPIETYYLDYYQNNPSAEPEAAGGYTPLQRCYAFEPIPEKVDSDKIAPWIDGVQGNLWTEQVKTEDHVEYMMYPRLLAIAETGWTTTAKDYPSFKHKAMVVLDRMKKQGYNSFDLRHEEGTRSESLNTVYHEGMGKPVKYLRPYSTNYEAKGTSTLTDGRLGDWSYRDGQWQGFISSGRLEVVIDMGYEASLTDISSEFMQFTEPGINYPGQIEVDVSSDGSHFTVLDKQDVADESTRYFIRPYQWEGHAKGRYVKFCARVSKRGGWVFVDEIMINKKNRVSLRTE